MSEEFQVDALFCIDRRIVSQFAVTATSLAINRPADMVRAFVLTSEEMPSAIHQLFHRLGDTYGLHFQLIHVPPASLDSFPVFGHVSQAAYLRLVTGDVLPEDVEWVLYCDSDLIFDGDISDPLRLAQNSITKHGAVLAAVPEIPTSFEHLHKKGLIGDRYFQSGVMLIHLPSWRKTTGMPEFVKALAKIKGSIMWWDQDILNVALEKNWVDLPVTLNGTPTRRTLDTLVYHFAGNQKPWIYRSDVDDVDVYERYRKQTKHLKPPKTNVSTVLEFYASRIRQTFRTLMRRLGLWKRTPTTSES